MSLDYRFCKAEWQTVLITSSGSCCGLEQPRTRANLLLVALYAKPCKVRLDALCELTRSHGDDLGNIHRLTQRFVVNKEKSQ